MLFRSPSVMAVLRKHGEELEHIWKPAITEGPGLDIFEESVKNHLDKAVECLLAGERLPSQAVCALYTQVLMQAARRSHENGGAPVKIQEFVREYPYERLEELLEI